jgi:Arc/MetJ-type ribon-helix-helix transcriptional regulator
MAIQSTFPITFKLTKIENEILDDVVAKGFYVSRSAALRHGLGLLFTHWQIDAHFERIIEAQRKQHQPRANGKIQRAQLRTITAKPKKKK